MTEDTEHGGIIPLEKWEKLATGGGGTPAIPMPFIKEIFLIDCNVAGTTHLKDIEARTEEVQPGTILNFRRDAENKYDDRAIMVFNQSGERIGFVPRKDNPILSRLMDAGKLIYGKVTEKEKQGNWLRITMEIYMRDF